MSSSSTRRPSQAPQTRIAISCGEPAGIGPDLVVQLAHKPWPVDLVVFADPKLIAARAAQLNLPLRLVDDAAASPLRQHQAGSLRVRAFALDATCEPGQLTAANARYVLRCLDAATVACRDGEFDALVTAPVHKGIINDAGIAFSGHTERLAEMAGGQPVMMLVAGSLRVALATTHLALSAVPAAITRESLRKTLVILNGDLKQKFGIEQPKIIVCGLNPHAGEGGHLGREEIEIIEPVLAELRRDGMSLKGPIPADTAFTQQALQGVDAVLAMYHDQGLPVLKHAGFGQAVNVTLGLPIIRTSVDHGTALDLAGSGQAEVGSLETALLLAIDLAQQGAGCASF